MFKTNKIIQLLLVFLYFQFSFSQVIPIKKDSLKLYEKIQLYSKKKRFTTFLHKLVFRPINSKRSDLKVEHDKYSNFEGKIVRKITIETLDPFGYSETDSLSKPNKWIERTGNRIHIKTKKLAIQNLLLVKKNKPLDSLLVKESERLIRTQRFIRSVAITMQTVHSDSVDVHIRVLDSWSIIPKGSITKTQTTVKFEHRNFLGIGHGLNTEIKNRATDGKSAYDLAYTIPNIKNTYIKTNLKYQIDIDDYYRKSVDIDRAFYSAFTKWGGGIYFDQQFRKDSLPDINLKYSLQNIKFNTQDYWVGHAFSIFEGHTENNRTTNLILSGRYLTTNYIENPTVEYDSIGFYADEKMFLSGLGINSRKFVQYKYIFNNGIIEDVPIGKIYGITGGYQNKNNLVRYYLGCRVAFGNYYKWGFLSVNTEFGTFFDKRNASQTSILFQANYFTNLLHFGNWKIRQFVKPQISLGYNRFNSTVDRLTINEEYQISGSKKAIYGTKKIELTLQTQGYSPWQVWGFRLNPYLNYSIALLGSPERGLTSSKAYSKIGVGIVINNDYLIFSSFQISLSYYPNNSTTGNNHFRTNSFETSDFGFQNFELDKPRTVTFK